MIFFTIFTFFLALVSVSASVISTPTVRSPFPDPLPFAQLDPRTPINDCDTGFYTDTTDGNSPLIEDCEALSHNLYEGGTNYLILNNKFYTVAQYKTCAVGLVSWDCENNNSIVTPPPLPPPLHTALRKILWLTCNHLFSVVRPQLVHGQDRRRRHWQLAPQLDHTCKVRRQSGRRGQGGGLGHVRLPD